MSDNEQATCGDCGHPLEEVRPGRHQCYSCHSQNARCYYCPLINEIRAYESARNEIIERIKLTPTDNPVRVGLSQALQIIKDEVLKTYEY